MSTKTRTNRSADDGAEANAAEAVEVGKDAHYAPARRVG